MNLNTITREVALLIRQRDTLLAACEAAKADRCFLTMSLHTTKQITAAIALVKHPAAPGGTPDPGNIAGTGPAGDIGGPTLDETARH